ncbi:macro domain-containing protein [Roseimicrobium sp. ORNL1]|uniref:macro domain-containing protein n=1 Tax=Roseimicrobium sp. ORNL1 TaxID=2711231 RepID=UPI0013E13742|nr:macro domain-containing protein [Roseimicrobium sp. ORNL1]QIF02816.1 Appr-1-p processing protein [Roseimicrobium sp. ORNL1]
MKLILCFQGITEVEIVAGHICRLLCDAIVSPANSFGFMDGRLDRLLSERFGWDLEKRVQEAIQSRPVGELLVGEAIVVPTHDDKTPWLICAPTMRVPMRICTSVNAYLAMKAILAAVMSYAGVTPIETIAVPGLGTGVGQLAPELSAGQMAQAYRDGPAGAQIPGQLRGGSAHASPSESDGNDL